MTDVGLGGYPPVVAITAAASEMLPSTVDGFHRVWTTLQLVSRPPGLDLNAHHRTNKTQAPVDGGMPGIG